MSAEDFVAWMSHMNLRTASAARALNLSRNTVSKYILEGAPEYIGLACAALAYGLPAWRKVGMK